MQRRRFLKGSLATSVVAVASGAGLFLPQSVLAAAWPSTAFRAPTLEGALEAVFGDIPVVDVAADDDIIKITGLLNAEDGADVPVKAETTLPDVESVTIGVANNPVPLVAQVDCGDAGLGFFDLRIKMAQTDNIQVFVKSGGKLYRKTWRTVVVIGGCLASNSDSLLIRGANQIARRTKMRVKARAGFLDVKGMISHPMQGIKADPQGLGHYVQSMTFLINGKEACQANLGSGVSKNPRIGVRIRGNKGDEVTMNWVDNKGEQNSVTAKAR